MVLGDVRAVNKVAYYPSVVRYLIGNPEGAIQVQRSRDTVGLGADAANPLCYYLGVARVPAPENQLQSAEEVAGSPGVFNDSVFNDAFDFKVSLNPGDGVNNDFAHYFTSLLAQ